MAHRHPHPAAPPRPRRIRRRIMMAALAVGVVAALAPATPANALQGGTTNRYAGVIAPTSKVFYGINGYIRQSGTVKVAPDLGQAAWITLCVNNCLDWVQIGTYQGYSPGASSPSAVHMYIENNWQNSRGTCFYDFSDLGVPPQANYPYYITYTGNSYPNDCGEGGRQYEYAFRIGSATAAPVGYGYLPGAGGIPISEVELHCEGSFCPPMNTDFIGTDNNHVANSSYGLHVKTTSTGTTTGWASWVSTTVPGTLWRSDGDPTYRQLAAFYSYSASQ